MLFSVADLAQNSKSDPFQKANYCILLEYKIISHLEIKQLLIKPNISKSPTQRNENLYLQKDQQVSVPRHYCNQTLKNKPDVHKLMNEINYGMCL